MLKHLCLSLGVMLGAGGTYAQYLDSTFGTYGIVRTTFTGTNESCSKVLVQPDKKILAGGTTNGNGGFKEFVLARYDTTGALDMTFGTGGKVVTPNGGTNNQLNDIVLQPDGKIIAVGIAMSGSFSPWATMIVRYNANGSIDNTFATMGIDTLQVSTKCDAYDVLVQPDNKILICGTDNTSGGYLLARYNANGTLDNTFGTNGIYVASTFGTGMAITLQPDNKILVAGEFWGSGPHAGISRHNANGTIDNTFGNFGMVIIPGPYVGEQLWGGHDVKVLSSGKILVPLYLNPTGIAHQPAIVRLNTNGTVDATFGTLGYAIGSYSNFYEQGEEMVVQPDGKIILAGFASPNSSAFRDSVIVMRFDTSGAVDPAFGTAGRITTKVDTGGTRSYSIALQADGKFILGGSQSSHTAKDFSLMRYRYTSGVTGIANAEKALGISIYPNPAYEVLNIKLANGVKANVAIYDINGRLLIEEVISSQQNTIGIKSLAPGMYPVSVTINGQTETSLFTKQ